VDAHEQSEPLAIEVEETERRAVSTSEAHVDDVLGLLAPLAAAYVRRAEPGATSRPTPAAAATPAPAPGSRPSFIACRVDGVVTIDSERRVLWPDTSDWDRRACVGLRALHGAIEVSLDAGPGAKLHAPDQRGRLRLPSGVLRAAGLAAGDRVVIARSEAAGPLLLVRADRVGIDLAVA
jgi:hypothetical protein